MVNLNGYFHGAANKVREIYESTKLGRKHCGHFTSAFDTFKTAVGVAAVVHGAITANPLEVAIGATRGVDGVREVYKVGHEYRLSHPLEDYQHRQLVSNATHEYALHPPPSVDNEFG